MNFRLINFTHKYITKYIIVITNTVRIREVKAPDKWMFDKDILKWFVLVRSMDKEAVLKRFDTLAPNYDNYISRVDGYSKTIDRIIELAEAQKPSIVLDLGTGTGTVSFRLAPRVAKVYARDISQKMLQVAKEKASKSKIENIDFGHGTFSEPNCSEKVDLIVSNLAFHHLYDNEKREAIKVWIDLLKPGGKVILGDHMWFFDHRKEPERRDRLVRKIIETLGDPKRPIEDQIEELEKRDHPANIYDLKKFFEEAGFIVEKIEETLSPVMGVIVAVKP
ncbi:MAG: methyltransferase domain-containing protein [Candidatus Jordarchaeaceae archaeon]